MTKEFDIQVQINLINYLSISDSNFKYLLIHYNYKIKVGKITLLITKTALAVSFALLEIFHFIGPLAILQSDNNAEFNREA